MRFRAAVTAAAVLFVAVPAAAEDPVPAVSRSSASPVSAPAVSAEEALTAWLSERQDPATGLVPSFEGDPALHGASFTYDQALLVQVFCLRRDFEKAEAILLFFESRAARADNFFYTAYDSAAGTVWEYRIHTGPNAWLGIGALRYGQVSGRRRFEKFAVSIGEELLRLQGEDPEGGLRGGPEETWHSVEHNLDAYVFFGMLYDATGDGRFAKARERVLEWLRRYGWDAPAAEIFRGKNDRTPAADVYSWAVAAIGPRQLSEFGLDPSAVMRNAESCFGVEADWPTAGRSARLKGFDFTAPASAGRPPVISSEWTAQAAVSFRILADFFDAAGDSGLAEEWRRKARDYADELRKMALFEANGRRASIAYASAPSVDTGHGWKTPAGRGTGSVAGSSYALFALKGFNPLGARGAV